MKHIIIYITLSLLAISSCLAEDKKEVQEFIQGYYKSKETGNNRWLGDNLSNSAIAKIKRMFVIIENSRLNDGDEIPDISTLSGGEVYLKLIDLAKGLRPNLGRARTGAKFRTIGVLDDGEDTKYVMYEFTWNIENSGDISQVSHFKIIKEDSKWKISLQGDIDKAIDLQIKQMENR